MKKNIAENGIVTVDPFLPGKVVCPIAPHVLRAIAENIRTQIVAILNVQVHQLIPLRILRQLHHPDMPRGIDYSEEIRASLNEIVYTDAVPSHTSVPLVKLVSHSWRRFTDPVTGLPQAKHSWRITFSTIISCERIKEADLKVTPGISVIGDNYDLLAEPAESAVTLRKLEEARRPQPIQG